MDKLDEVKKLKNLLDEGIIDEDDFKRKKAEILGLSKKEDINVSPKIEEKKETKTKSKSLDEYEKELIEQSDIEDEVEEKSSSKNVDDFYQKEKAKARAKLDAEEEIRNKRKAETREAVNKGANKVKRIFKWILAVFCWMMGIASVCMVGDWFMNLPEGILFLLLGCMACPKITDYTQNNSKFDAYTKHKTIIVWIIVILWIALVCIFPAPNSSSNPENTTNNTVESSK